MSPMSGSRSPLYGGAGGGSEKVGELIYLDSPDLICCAHCCAHIAAKTDIMSKTFYGRSGRAFLMNKVVNVKRGVAEKRMLITGYHTVCDIFCANCKTVIGWKYDKAHEQRQKYKEGKFVIEKAKIRMQDWL